VCVRIKYGIYNVIVKHKLYLIILKLM
jgi:hypothetical protein